MTALPSLGLGLDHLPLGVLLHQLDLLAGQLVDLPLLRAGRLDDQADLGAARAADVADDVAELLLDEVDLVAVFLLDADDLVLGLEPAVLVGRHAGDDLLDDRVAVLRLERRADAFERQVQRLADHVLERLGAHVARVRVERPGQAAQVDLEQVAHVELVDDAVAVPVADRELLDRLLALDLVDDLELEQVELDLLPPALVGLLGVGRVVVGSGSSTIDSSTVKSGFCLSSSLTVASRSSDRFR